MSRKHAMVRPVRSSDTQQFIKWSRDTKNNLFDPHVATYPSTVVRCAFVPDKVIVYAPVQRPLFIEALAINPEATELEVAAGLKAITQDTIAQAYIQGAGEIYFLCKDEATMQFATHHYFKEMPWRVFRIKLNELESQVQPSPDVPK